MYFCLVLEVLDHHSVIKA